VIQVQLYVICLIGVQIKASEKGEKENPKFSFEHEKKSTKNHLVSLAEEKSIVDADQRRWKWSKVDSPTQKLPETSENSASEILNFMHHRVSSFSEMGRVDLIRFS
jgi:hypothetical protein